MSGSKILLSVVGCVTCCRMRCLSGMLKARETNAGCGCRGADRAT